MTILVGIKRFDIAKSQIRINEFWYHKKMLFFNYHKYTKKNRIKQVFVSEITKLCFVIYDVQTGVQSQVFVSEITKLCFVIYDVQTGVQSQVFT